MSGSEERYCLYCRHSKIDGDQKLVCYKHYKEVGFSETCQDYEDYPEASEYLRSHPRGAYRTHRENAFKTSSETIGSRIG